MGKRVARAFMVLGILVPCNMAFAEDITAFLPTFTPEEQAELARGRAAYPQPQDGPASRELQDAVDAALSVGKDSMREAELGQQFTSMICDGVKVDAAHKTPGYRFVEDRAKACVDDVNLSRDLGLEAPEAESGKSVSPDQRAFLACMARECESRVLTRLFAPDKK
jgi:hypothetical protein